ncbi:MAG: hypothetical protein ACI9Z9_002852, partial [Litorivivens sp.]
MENDFLQFLNQQSSPMRVMLLIIFAVMIHLLVVVVRWVAEHVTTGARSKTQKKSHSIITLTCSASVF